MCDPNQSAFQQVVSERNLDILEGEIKVADKIRYHVSNKFAVSKVSYCMY